jgi:hypothetical protein
MNGRCSTSNFLTLPAVPGYTAPLSVPSNYLPAQPAGPATFRWELNRDGAAALYRDSTHVGSFYKGRFYPFDNGRWGDPYPPKDQPALEVGQLEVNDGKPMINFGLSLDKVHANDHALVGDTNALPDDSTKPRVIIRSSDAALVSRIKSDLAPIAGKAVVQAYPPGHWALSPGLDFGLIHVETAPGPDGKAKMVHNQNDYDGPAGVFAALRKADPSFDPAAVPDCRKPDVSPLSSVDALLAWLKSPSPVAGLPWYVVLGVGGLVAYKFRDKWMPTPPDKAAAKAEALKKVKA